MKLFAFLAVAVLALVAGPVAAQQCNTACAPAVQAQVVVPQQYQIAPAAIAVPVAVVAVPSAPVVQLQVLPQQQYHYAAPAVVQQVVVQRQVVQAVKVQQVKVQAVEVHAAPQRVFQRSVFRSR